MTYDDSGSPASGSGWSAEGPPSDDIYDIDGEWDEPSPTSSDWEEFLDVAMPQVGTVAGTTLTPGLNLGELTALEEVFQAPLPTEVGLFLRRAVPVSTDPTKPRWYDWRAAPEQQRERFVAQIRSGIVFDVRHNGFWAPVWGAAPAEIEDRVARCQQCLDDLPPLFPLFGHRGIALEPPPDHDTADGNPVFSVQQTDVVYYGYDLAGWLCQEFGVAKPTWARTSPRRIPFWSELATGAWR